MMWDTRLVDMGYKGQNYTWCNNRVGRERIKERLDRAIGNRAWISLFPRTEVTHKLNIDSYHCPIVVNFEPKKNHKTKKPFRFENTWLEQSECQEIVKGVWDESQSVMVKMEIH